MRIPLAAAVILLAAARSVATQTETLVEKERRRQAMDHDQKGRDAMTAERFEEAVAEFKAAIDLDPLLTLAYFRKGQAHMTLREYAQAEQAFLGCRRAHENLARLQFWNSQEVEREREEVFRELENKLLHTPIGGPDSSTPSRPPTLAQDLARLERQRHKTGQEATAVPAELNVSLGSAYFRQGKMDLAEKEWKTAVLANPKLGEAHNNLAALYLMTQRFDDAEKELELAEKAGYHVHPRLKEDIKARKASPN